MKSINSLIGQKVRVFIDGGYDLVGILESIDAEKIIVKDKESYYLVFKSKIYMVLLNLDNATNVGFEEPGRLEYHAQHEQDEPEPAEEDKFVMNGINSENTYGSILPASLWKEPVTVRPPSEEVDLSISLANLQNEEFLLGKAARLKIIEQNKKRILDDSKK